MSVGTKEFHKLKLPVDELFGKLDTSERAALAVSSHCVNEMNTLRKLVWMSDFRGSGNGIQDWLKAGQEATLFRSLTIRLFDFWKFIKKMENQNGDVGVIAKAKVAELANLEGSVGHSVAKIIRDRAAAHSSFDDAKKALSHIDGSQEIWFINSREAFNSYYSFGDDTFVFAHLRSLVDEQYSVRDLMERWYEWSRVLANILSDFHDELVDALIVRRFQDRQFELENVPLPAHLIVDAFSGYQLPTYVENLPR